VSGESIGQVGRIDVIVEPLLPALLPTWPILSPLTA